MSLRTRKIIKKKSISAIGTNNITTSWTSSFHLDIRPSTDGGQRAEDYSEITGL